MKTNPPCEANGCSRTAIRQFHLSQSDGPSVKTWLCGTCAKDVHTVIRSPAQQSAHVKALKAKPRKPNPASASNGKTGGRPRTTTPSPDVLREAARILREYMDREYAPDLVHGTGRTYLEPVAAMLDRMAKGVRPEKAITTPQRTPEVSEFLNRNLMRDMAFRPKISEARASLALDKDTRYQTLTKCAVEDCPKSTSETYCADHVPDCESKGCNHRAVRMALVPAGGNAVGMYLCSHHISNMAEVSL